MEQQEFSCIAGGIAKWYTHFVRPFAISYKTKHILNIPSTIALLGIYPKELKTYVYTKTCTKMFIAALFIIAETWKQQKYPLAAKWIIKLWSFQTMKYYSVLERNEL